MPRKTWTVAMIGAAHAHRFNEAAARCRGKPRVFAVDDLTLHRRLQ